jgi:hypothetical protein
MADGSVDHRTTSRELRTAGARRRPTTTAVPMPRARVVGAPARPRPAASAPPPRPPVASDLAVPGAGVHLRSAPPPRPRALRLSVVLWLGACLAGLAGVGAALADGDALRDRLTDTARAVDPAATTEAVTDAVGTSILLVVGAVVVLALVTTVSTVLVHQRRVWARWVLLGTGLLTLFVADVAQSSVAGGNDLDRILLLTQAGLIVVAVVLLFTRSSGRWIRGRDDGPPSVQAGQQGLESA